MGSPTEAADMQAAAAAALLAIASGLVAADGVDHGDHGAQHGTVLASEPLAAQPVDNSNYYNYNTDTFAATGSDGFYDPYASNFLTQEQDRTDGGGIGGLTIGVLLTVFLASLLGSIVARAQGCQRRGCRGDSPSPEGRLQLCSKHGQPEGQEVLNAYFLVGHQLGFLGHRWRDFPWNC